MIKKLFKVFNKRGSVDGSSSRTFGDFTNGSFDIDEISIAAAEEFESAQIIWNFEDNFSFSNLNETRHLDEEYFENLPFFEEEYKEGQFENNDYEGSLKFSNHFLNIDNLNFEKNDNDDDDLEQKLKRSALEKLEMDPLDVDPIIFDDVSGTKNCHLIARNPTQLWGLKTIAEEASVNSKEESHFQQEPQQEPDARAQAQAQLQREPQLQPDLTISYSDSSSWHTGDEDNSTDKFIKILGYSESNTSLSSSEILKCFNKSTEAPTSICSSNYSTTSTNSSTCSDDSTSIESQSKPVTITKPRTKVKLIQL
ncbi:hypothetical protein PACTADRAFT_32079 [Pachysolen tannophilus NRRL Y-2460]|uniref:Uncharacterized protein n=1 Tax=Pachysolen tannophilus NRRL Y-2460 TaxID=669874 RepID=A0A1E4TXU4_PACTA|nr:hypothetical protein PACTADRAFT_32079 [Pachysolen tannophilus NRRL Y-2460]